MVKKKICVFISGRGTNLEALIKSSRNYSFPGNISLIVSNNADSKGLKFAKMYSIPFLIFQPKSQLSEKKLTNEIKNKKIRIICLAGYMKILTKKFIRGVGCPIINIHPSLLPKYKGLNTYERIIKFKEAKTGCTVHHVNEKLTQALFYTEDIFIWIIRKILILLRLKPKN